jgi:molecular chaperone GrpE (heat shock protein)
MYRNTYLEKMGELLKHIMDVANDIEKAVKELTDEEKIKEMFRNDVEFVMDKFYGGDITANEALNNLSLLKIYVISQLDTHYKRIAEVLDDLEKKVRRLKEEVSEGIMADLVEFIVNTIEKAEMELKET